MAHNYANMSMIEVAEHLMSRKKTPQSFKKIAQEVSELMGLTEEYLNQRLSRFYADLTLSGKFVNVGGDKWDLKNRQKYDVGDYQLLFDDNDVNNKKKKKNTPNEEEEEVEEVVEEDNEIEEDYEEEYDNGHDEI